MSSFNNYLETVGEIGYVKSVQGYLVHCSGLAGARISEKVYFEDDQIGFVDSIGPDSTSILLLDGRSIGFGKMVVRTGERLTASVSNDFLGRVVDVFGNPLDGRGKVKNIVERELDPPAVPMIDRERTTENLETGVTLVDLLIPLGKGQRQLVMGDQKTGKTSFLMQLVARQTQLGAVCIYASIAKKQADLVSILERLKELGAMEKTVVVAAGASAPSSLIYLAPFYAFSLAEHFRDQGKDVLIILDEISRHAKYYREISSLERKMPGREGYPGDIFHMHAHLMERAGRFIIGKGEVGKETLTLAVKGKTASITCFPVVQT
ncbi:MAG: F0F1 ATP synthase subunit alpha, partial [Candidatus Paceibacterales bacterium]